MIPKKIHFCWLSGDKIPSKIGKCIDSWKRVMPDYEIIKWDTNKFNIESHPFVLGAYKLRKWAFAADYIRLYALYTEGGIYLDSDVIVRKKFDEFLKLNFFTAIEFHKQVFEEENGQQLLNSDGTSKKTWTPIPGIGIQAAIMGSLKGLPYVYDCLNFYNDKQFVYTNNSFNITALAPAIFAMIAEKYGFKYVDEEQILSDNMTIFPSSVFAGTLEEMTQESYAVHLCNGSWRNKPREPKSIKKTIIYQNIRSIFKKGPI